MNQPWSCSTIVAGLVLAMIVLIAVGAIDLSPSQTTNTLIAADRACEVQTGERCD